MLISLGGVTVGEEDQDFFLTDVQVDLGSLRTGDADLPYGHGARPGRDFRDAGTVTLSLCTRYGINDAASADLAVGRFMRAWGAGMRLGPGEMMPMRVVTGDRSRVLYGRPRRVSPPAPDSAALNQGIATIIAEFRVLDPFVYDQAESGLSLSVVPRSLGGIIAPITTPVTTTMTSGVEYRMMTVTGDAPAPLRVTFHGPARDPRLAADGVEILGVVGSLAYDEDITVDGRTRTVALADGTPAGHRLARSSRLDLLRVEPGVHELAFSATDRTGTARVTVEATPTFYHL